MKSLKQLATEYFCDPSHNQNITGIPIELQDDIRTAKRLSSVTFPGDKVICPSCKNVDNPMCYHHRGECIFDESKETFLEYFDVPDYSTVDTHKLFCHECQVACLACPICSMYDKNVDYAQSTIGTTTLILMKYMGFDMYNNSNCPNATYKIRPNVPLRFRDKQRFGVDSKFVIDEISEDIKERFPLDFAPRSKLILRYCGDRDQFYGTEDDFQSGENGGEHVYFKCIKCNNQVRLTDK